MNQRFAVGGESEDLDFDAGDEALQLAEFFVKVNADSFLFSKRGQWNGKLANLGCVRAGEVGRFLSSGLEVVASILGGSDIGEEHRLQFVAETPHCEDVVLVQASRDLAFPQIASTELIKLSA